jgi:hypothetical protein
MMMMPLWLEWCDGRLHERLQRRRVARGGLLTLRSCSPAQGLAKSIAWDGEGATCLVEIEVQRTQPYDSRTTAVRQPKDRQRLSACGLPGSRGWPHPTRPPHTHTPLSHPRATTHARAIATHTHIHTHNHVCRTQVKGAASDADARVIARSVAGSSLAKSAIFGHDPNWGRIAAAAGYSGA